MYIHTSIRISVLPCNTACATIHKKPPLSHTYNDLSVQQLSRRCGVVVRVSNPKIRECIHFTRYRGIFIPTATKLSLSAINVRISVPW